MRDQAVDGSKPRRARLCASTDTVMTTIQRDIVGQPTEIVLQSFSDRVLVLVTQVGKVGNLVCLDLPLRLLIGHAKHARVPKDSGKFACNDHLDPGTIDNGP